MLGVIQLGQVGRYVGQLTSWGRMAGMLVGQSA